MSVAPDISVVCPAFNSADYISVSLSSVFGQTQLPSEIIVSDDGSADGTVEIVREIFNRQHVSTRCYTLRNEHRGPGAARNAGILAASGEWIAFLDSDDLWLLQKLERVSTAIKQYPEINFFCHHEEWVDRQGARKQVRYARKYRHHRSLSPQLYVSNLFSTSAVVCRRSLLLEHGLFDEDLTSAQDYELWLRLSPYLRPHFIEEVLGCYIDRPGNITSSRLSARIANELRIALRHRKMVSASHRVMRVVRIFASYANQLARRLMVRWRNSRSII